VLDFVSREIPRFARNDRLKPFCWRSQARSLFTLESGSGFSCCCKLSAHLFHKLAHASDVTR